MRVSYLNKISPLGLNTFNDKYQITDDVENSNLLLVRSFNMHEMELNPNLLAVARAGAGVNNIPLERMGDAGIVVFNTPGANANGVKELVIAGMLMSSRDLIGGINWVKNNREDTNILKSIEKAKSAFAGTEILGKTILVLGLGAIGGKVANACASLGLKVIGYDPYISNEAKELLNSDVEINNNLGEVYPQADFVSLHIPLLDSTREMFNEEIFKQLKPGCVLLNFSRDLLIKDEDLKKALEDGTLKYYVTDFPNHFVANLDKVITFPHLGASTKESEDNCAIMAAKQLMAYVERGEIINSVNYPNVRLETQNTASRMIVLAENEPSTAREIDKSFLSISELIKGKISKVKGKYAYYALDIDAEIEDSYIKTVEAVKGVYRVRVIK
jgi:D-3-phosphoglycerate dehydrogenase